MARADVLERELTEEQREKILREMEQAWQQYERRARRGKG